MRYYKCSLPTDPASAIVVQHLCEQGQVCADHRLQRGDLQVVALQQDEIRLLEQAGIDVKILSEEATGFAGGDSPPAGAIATGFVSGYLDSTGIDAAFDNLHILFPALTTITNLPEITTGYDGAAGSLAGPSPVRLFRISTTPAIFSKPGLLVVSGLHAREWAPPLAAIEFASQLLHNYDPASADPDIIAINALVENLDILIVGAGNPDGIDFSHHDDAWWRKNRRPNAGSPGCPGVDNNRNFSIYWGQGGSSADPCDFQIYHGPLPFSEVENRNIKYIVEQFPNVLAAIDCHSYGEDFLRPQPGGGSFIASEPVPAGDNAIYTALETSMNAAVSAVSAGKTYSTGTTSNHAGTFDEYMYFGHRIFAFEVEIGEDFQPPIADALISVQEAAGVMRALAKETLNLSARFINPATVVQVIDKSSSMISSGYVAAAQGNAQRLIDLMSLNDSTAIVSFNGSANTELALTPILTAGDYNLARSAVAGIPFGGSTSIGAGLQQGLSLLPPPGNPRSILLLSDGYENTAPMVSSILPTIPAGVAVHTIALGLASDQALLQHIAATTGGTYFFSPDELELFNIYNVARGDLSDSDLVSDGIISFPAGDSMIERSKKVTRQIVIDCDADYADFSIAAHQPGVYLEAELHCLSVPNADLSRLEQRSAPGYVIMRLKRPQPGIYQVTVSVVATTAVTCSLSAWVKSPLRLGLGKAGKPISPGSPIDFHFSLPENEKMIRKFSISAEVHAPATSIKRLARQWKKEMGLPAEQSADSTSKEVALAMIVRDYLCRTKGKDPFHYIRRPAHLIHPKIAHAPLNAIALRSPTSKTLEGTYNLRFVVQGHTHSGCAFMRVGFRSFLVG